MPESVGMALAGVPLRNAGEPTILKQKVLALPFDLNPSGLHFLTLRQ